MSDSKKKSYGGLIWANCAVAILGVALVVTAIVRTLGRENPHGSPLAMEGSWYEVASTLSKLESQLETARASKETRAAAEGTLEELATVLRPLELDIPDEFGRDWKVVDALTRAFLSAKDSGPRRTERTAQIREIRELIHSLQDKVSEARSVVAKELVSLERNTAREAKRDILIGLGGLLVLLIPPVISLLAVRRIAQREAQVSEILESKIAQYTHSARASVEKQRLEFQEGQASFLKLEARFRSVSTLISNSSMILWATDINGVYTFRDGHGLAALGLVSGDGVGQHFSEVKSGSPGTLEVMQRALAGESFAAEHHAGERWYKTRFDPLRSGNGALVGVCGVTTDITSRKIAEHKALEEEGIRQATRLKTEFMANMSHELRTPMNGIVGMVGLLGSTRLSDEQQGMLDVIQSSTDSLLRTVNDIIDLTRLESGKLALNVSEFCLRDVVFEVVRSQVVAAEKKGLELVVDVDPGCRASLRGDSDRIRQVLANLVDNAVKYTKQGHVLVQVRSASCAGDSQQLVISISDTGAGIEPGRLADLGKPHDSRNISATRKVGDVGFGIALAKMLISLMGGSLDLNSTVGRGTLVEVSVVLPNGKAPLPHVNEPQLGGKRILVADDCEVTRGILALKLAALGAQVDVAVNGHEAMRQCVESLEKQAVYDLAIVDRLMPVIDGPTFASMVRGTVGIKNIPMLLLSSTAEPLEPARREPFAKELSKPIDELALFDAVAELFTAARSSPPSKPEFTSQPSPSVEEGPLRLLIADDNAVNLAVCRKMLEKLGHKVDAFADGKQLVEALQKQSYDAIFTDCQMPVMDGYEATRTIRASGQPWADIWIVAVTANATVADRDNCMACGMNDFISKPLRITVIETALQTLRRASVPSRS